MKNQNASFVIVSAELDSLSVHENTVRSEEFGNQLEALGVPFKGVLGCYKGVREVSYVLPIEYERVAVMALREYGQECYLRVRSDSSAETVTFTSLPDFSLINKVGYFREVCKAVAIGKNNYTYDSENDRYWTTLDY